MGGAGQEDAGAELGELLEGLDRPHDGRGLGDGEELDEGDAQGRGGLDEVGVGVAEGAEDGFGGVEVGVWGVWGVVVGGLVLGGVTFGGVGVRVHGRQCGGRVREWKAKSLEVHDCARRRGHRVQIGAQMWM